MIEELREPCWALHHEAFDYQPHYDTRDEAVEDAGDDPQRHVVRCLDLCWIRRCDRCGREHLLDDEELGPLSHWMTRDDALMVERDHGSVCDDCQDADTLGSVAFDADGFTLSAARS